MKVADCGHLNQLALLHDYNHSEYHGKTCTRLNPEESFKNNKLS